MDRNTDKQTNRLSCEKAGQKDGMVGWLTDSMTERKWKMTLYIGIFPHIFINNSS